MATAGARYSLCVALVCLVSSGATSTLGLDRLSERVLTSVGPEAVIFFASPKPSEDRLRFLLTLVARSAPTSMQRSVESGRVPATAPSNRRRCADSGRCE